MVTSFSIKKTRLHERKCTSGLFFFFQAEFHFYHLQDLEQVYVLSAIYEVQCDNNNWNFITLSILRFSRWTQVIFFWKFDSLLWNKCREPFMTCDISKSWWLNEYIVLVKKQTSLNKQQIPQLPTQTEQEVFKTSHFRCFPAIKRIWSSTFRL